MKKKFQAATGWAPQVDARALEYGPARMSASYLSTYASLLRARRSPPFLEPSEHRQPHL